MFSINIPPEAWFYLNWNSQDMPPTDINLISEDGIQLISEDGANLITE